MSEANNAVVRRFEEAYAANDVEVIDELCAPDLVDHNPNPGHEPTLAGLKTAITEYQAAFPDAHTELHAVFGEGDLVATRWSVTGTHDGDFFGLPPTGKHAAVEGMNIYRLANGKITDVWTQFDGLGLMEQLGATPP